ncbi:MAG TPA: plasmid maintenance protein CcdB [Aurantimonas coralicida]|uniref:Toxin CcdB n=2 Tax=root TaxID=1 RepID=A0A9C9NFZ0_9HYPH|nr:plasmid maintenance protein CcdB [Aurantimonas coralicida]HEU00553.1 plasmid maintenance protein CcdB [Aurantimonas coralicida]
MARHDVHALSDGRGLVLNVQSDILDALNTRVVVPLLPIAHAPKPAKRLNPVFEIGRMKMVMATQFLSAIPLSALGETVQNLSSEHDAIVAALDMIFQGF